MAKYKKQKCIHCLKYFNILTEDHIFPKSWYPDSTPEHIEKWTAPACKKCNSELGIAEEKLFNRLLVCIDPNEIGALGLNKKLQKLTSFEELDERSAGRQMKFLKETVENFIPYLYEEGNERVLKGGTPKEGVRSRRMIRIPNKELLIVSEKIIRGLEYKLRGRLVNSYSKINIITPRENQAELKQVENWRQLTTPEEENLSRGPGFVVKYGVSPNDDKWIIYNTFEQKTMK